MKTSAGRAITALAFATGLSVNPAAFGQGPASIPAAVANSAMPVAQQNALVQKYCAVCHTDAKPLGGLSLEKFDATHLDPSLAAMMAGKLKARAMGAAGIPLPDKTTQDSLLNALLAEAVGSTGWTVTQTRNPSTQGPILTASILREAHSTTDAGEPEIYRLALTCHVDTHEAEMQLTWAPGPVPWNGAMSAAVDGKAPFTYKLNQGEASALLSASREKSGSPKFAMPLPTQTLTIRDVFPGKTIVFPFEGLTPAIRQTLSTCFTGSDT